MRGSFPSHRGFTLLEVAVALAILAVAFTAFAAVQARNLALTAEDRTLTTATLAAQDVIARLEAGMLPLEDGEGDLGENFPGWRWRLRSTDTQFPGLHSIEVIVFKAESDPETGTSFKLFLRQGSKS